MTSEKRMKSDHSRDLDRLLDGLILHSEGSGPLLQRDYWAVVEDCRLSPPDVADLVSREFCNFAPESLVRFERSSGEAGGDGDGEQNPADSESPPLEEGDELDVAIRMAGTCRVRVVHRDRNSLTLATLKGHPEAGRITFGTYRNDDGRVVFHIRSRARASSGTRYAGFVAAGEPMQATTWTDFVDRVAHTVGAGVVGVIRVETAKMEEDEPDDPEVICSPTFLAVGD